MPKKQQMKIGNSADFAKYSIRSLEVFYTSPLVDILAKFDNPRLQQLADAMPDSFDCWCAVYGEAE